MQKIRPVVISLLLMVMLTGCFTGVENTKKISDKDVKKAMREVESRQSVSSLTRYVDSVPAWGIGKRFYVSEDQSRRMFYRDDRQPLDTLRLEGDTLRFVERRESQDIDGKRRTTLVFTTTEGVRLCYDTRKAPDSFTSNYEIPFLIDLDMIDHIAKQIAGKELYIKTPIWYDVDSEEMIDGKKFIPVRITHVAAGNKVLPLRVEFSTLNGQRAMVWMSADTRGVMNRDFDSLFSLTDVRQAHKQISDEVWRLIIDGKVQEGMTKEECTLSKGSPLRIDRLPDQGGLREYWRYNNGEHLYFEDGILKKYR